MPEKFQWLRNSISWTDDFGYGIIAELKIPGFVWRR
jgi:hypothetical protein